MKMTIWETFQVKVEKNWEKPSFADSADRYRAEKRLYFPAQAETTYFWSPTLRLTTRKFPPQFKITQLSKIESKNKGRVSFNM